MSGKSLVSGGTCPLSKADIDAPNAEEPIFSNITFQELIFYIGGACSIVTLIAGSTLIARHLFCYTRPREQRQIIRIAFYPIVSAALSCFSIYSYPDSLYMLPARSLYEPIALAAIFFLFVEFAAPNPHTRDTFFHELEHKVRKGSRFSRQKEWVSHEGGSLRWFQSKWVALYFYFVASLVIRIVQEATQATGRYCQTSFSPQFAHVWVLVISNLVLPVGIVAVLQFYMRMKTENHFQAHHPTSKLLSFKSLIILDFLQEIIFDILVGAGVFKSTKTITTRDFNIGIPSLLIIIEQMAVTIWFHWSFNTAEYHEDAKTYKGEERMNVFRAILSALDPSDLMMGFIYAVRLLLKGVGPKGNGSWRKSGGYTKIKGAVGTVQLESGTAYRGGSDMVYLNENDSARLHGGDDESHHENEQEDWRR